MKNLRNITLILLVAFLSILFAEKTIQVPLKKRVVISSHDETDQIYQRLFININHGKIGVEKVCYSYEDDECTYYTKDTYRTAFKFNLTNIPDDAEITDAWIKVSITNLGADADTSWEAAIKPVIKDIEDNSNSPSSLFNDMADGTQYFSDSEITFGDDDPTTYRDDNLITNIQSNLEEKNWIAFGIYSQEEAPFGENEFGYGDARAKLELYVTYYREHDITVETSFDGGYLKLDGNQINHGTPVPLEEFTNHTLYAENQHWPTLNNYYRVFKQEWRKDEELMIGYTEPEISVFITNEATYSAKFVSRFDIDVYYTYLNGGSGGDVLVNSSPKPTPYSGYMYEESPLTLEAPDQTKTINGRNITYKMTEWNDGNTSNPRALTPNDHFDVTAVYKGHLVSNTSRATGYNNGRRITKTDNGTLHQVYEDNGDIYYTSSSNNGTTWAAEKRLDIDSHTCKNPAITSSSNTVFVTWFDDTDNDIDFRRYIGSSWESTKKVRDVALSGNIKPSPAIAVSEVVGGQYKIYIISHIERVDGWGSPIGGYRVECYKSISSSGSAWSRILGPINGKNPSISHSASGGNGDIGMVWENSNKIYFKKTNYSGSWSSTKQISPNLPYIWDEGKPNISYSFGVAHIVWEAMEEDEEAEIEMLTGYHRYYDAVSNTLGPLENMPHHGSELLRDLSVSTTPGNGNDYTIFYESEGFITKISKTGSSMSESTYGPGNYPSIVDHGRDASVWSKYSNAPYFVKTNYSSSGLSKSTNSLQDTTIAKPLAISKRFGFDLSGSSEKLQFLSIDLQTTMINGTKSFFDDDNKSNTLHFSGEDVIQLTWKISHSINTGEIDPDMELINIWLVEGNKRTLLKKYNAVDFTSTDKRTVSSDLIYSAMQSKQAHLEIGFGKIKPVITNLLERGDDTKSLAKESGLAYEADIIPEKYELNQNYPNPFNPVTHISFGLPESGNTSLKVYNTQGQKVAELINGYKQAGTYEVVFNSSGLASGLYFYHLQSGGFSRVKRMLLVK